MRPVFSSSKISVSFTGRAIPGADDRQRKIAGFDQEKYSSSSVLLIGSRGLISHIAPTVVRKGIGAVILLDDDTVEASNLNRQRFYSRDIGKNKAVALAENLRGECIAKTTITGYAFRFEQALKRNLELGCDVAVCGVDNNPTRIAASQYFRSIGEPVIFSAVSRDGDHGYVFVQGPSGPCISCLFPDMADDDRYPCPGTPAIADILQAVGALSVYAIDSVLMERPRLWNYRHIWLSGGAFDASQRITVREECRLCGT
jgi:molybdopterin/thiamine biosynthesis adenylyltransferase